MNHPRAPHPPRWSTRRVAVAGVVWGALVATVTQESLRANPWPVLLLLLLTGMVTTAVFACSGRREMELASVFTMFAAPTLVAFACTPLNEVTGLLYICLALLALLPVIFFFATVCLRRSVSAGLLVLLPLLTLYALPFLEALM